jgi:DNA-binding NarL/FixJ family response regulator
MRFLRSKDAAVSDYFMTAMAVRILIVDDSPVFREGLRRMLEDHVDWQVCGEAIDGAKAVEKNRSLVPHLIVMDFSMPNMSGLEASHAILKEFPKVPILLLTLYLTHHLAEQARDLGIRATLSKTDMQHLVYEIEAILSSEKCTGGVN